MHVDETALRRFCVLCLNLFTAEMLYLSGLSVALALALVPSSSEALKEGGCEGEFIQTAVAKLA